MARGAAFVVPVVVVVDGAAVAAAAVEANSVFVIYASECKATVNLSCR